MLADTTKSLVEKQNYESPLQRQPRTHRIRLSSISPTKERTNSSYFHNSQSAAKFDFSRQETIDFVDFSKSSEKVALWTGSPPRANSINQPNTSVTERMLTRIKEEKQHHLSSKSKLSLKSNKAHKKSMPDVLRFKEVFVVPRENAIRGLKDKEKSLLDSSINKSLRDYDKVINTQPERKDSIPGQHKVYLRSLSHADFASNRPEALKTLRKGSMETSVDYASPEMPVNRSLNKLNTLKALEYEANVRMPELSEIPKERLIFEELMKIPVRNKNTGTSSPLAEERGIAQIMVQGGNFFKENMKDLEMKVRGKTKAIMNDFSKIANLNFDMGNLHDEKNEFKEAIQSFMKFLVGAQRVGDKIGITLAMNRLGISYHYLRQYKESLEYHLQALAISNREDAFASYYNIGVASRKLENYAQTLNYLEKALECAKEYKDPELVCLTVGQMGITCMEMGSLDEAKDYFKQCYELAGDLKNIKLQLDFLIIISKIARSSGTLNNFKSTELLNIYQKAYYCAKKVEKRRTAEICLCNMGVIKGIQQFKEYTKNFDFENVEGLYE